MTDPVCQAWSGHFYYLAGRRKEIFVFPFPAFRPMYPGRPLSNVDLQDTLSSNRDRRAGMAANMIGVKMRDVSLLYSCC